MRKVVVLASARSLLTKVLTSIHDKIFHVHPFMGRGFFRLIMHYALHGVLKRCLRLLRSAEAGLEALMRQNRQVAKAIDAEKRQTHLTAIADHKIETALSPREKQRRRAHT